MAPSQRNVFSWLFVSLMILSLALVGCSSKDASGSAECDAPSDCGSGEVCVDGDCMVVCSRHSDCGDGNICIGSVCVIPNDSTLPVIENVSGNNSLSPNHILDGIIVAGAVLGEAEFEMVGATHGVFELTIREQSASHVELVFPVDIRTDNYTLVATNSAGSDQESVQLILPDLDGDALVGKINDSATTAKIALDRLAADVQKRVSSSCAVGESIRQINADGSVLCQPDTQLSEADVEGLIANDLVAGSVPYSDGTALTDTTISYKDQMVGIGTTDPAGMLHVGHGFSYAKVGPLGILADMAGDRCACDDEADTANVDCEDAFDSVDDQGDFCWDSQAGGFAQFERQQFQGFIITDSGNVGIANQNPSTTLQVGTSFSVDAQASVTQTSRYVKEFSGVITSPSCDPDIATIATIGRITDSTYESFVEITLFGSHRGYQRSTSYFDYKKWVVLFGDKVSANLVGSAGAGNKVGLFNGAATGDYDNIEIDTGFDIRLKAEPQCGSHLRYTYVVRYYSGANFTPDAKRVW